MTEFKGNLGKYKILQTEDQSETVWSEFFNEACHNLSGAYEETLYNYILGCGIPELFAQTNPVSILDVGFGVGVGLKGLLDEFHKSNNSTLSVNYYSIELDEALLLWSLAQTLPDIQLEKKQIPSPTGELVVYQGEVRGSHQQSLSIVIFLGDGRQTLPKARDLELLRGLDAIFQDAFSPRKNPALWSTEWFSFLKMISKKTVSLSTYSSSNSIRKSLIAAGWCVENARGFAMKRSMTKANLLGETSEELLLQLSRSPSLEIKDK